MWVYGITAFDNIDYELEKVSSFIDKYFKYHDGRSIERIGFNILVVSNIGLDWNNFEKAEDNR